MNGLFYKTILLAGTVFALPVFLSMQDSAAGECWNTNFRSEGNRVHFRTVCRQNIATPRTIPLSCDGQAQALYNACIAPLGQNRRDCFAGMRVDQYSQSVGQNPCDYLYDTNLSRCNTDRLNRLSNCTNVRTTGGTAP